MFLGEFILKEPAVADQRFSVTGESAFCQILQRSVEHLQLFQQGLGSGPAVGQGLHSRVILRQSEVCGERVGKIPAYGSDDCK
jgi:hypothetical protein